MKANSSQSGRKVSMEFKCYAMYSGKAKDAPISEEECPAPNTFETEPVSWCIVGGRRVFTGPTLEYTKQLVELEFGTTHFTEDCGWILVGEEHKLLDPECRELMDLTEQLKRQGQE